VIAIGVVDDDKSVRDALSSLIQSAGYQRELFPSADAFLDSNRFGQTDCILLDVQMPGLNGIELRSRLRAMKCLVPVIFVTAGADGALRQSPGRWCDRVLEKRSTITPCLAQLAGR
jgi:FixJ family two-component response regulator